MATVHGNHLMDRPYRVPEGLSSWLDVVTTAAGHRFAQRPPGRYRTGGFDDFAAFPGVREYRLDGTGAWRRLDGGGDLTVEGRLIGGCVETLAPLAWTPFLDTTAFARAEAPEGLLVYLEAADADAFTMCRLLHGVRPAGFFERARAVLVGRRDVPDSPGFGQYEAVVDAPGPLGVPLPSDVECGHVPPYLALVNGALARVEYSASGRGVLTQSLV
ncbi:hypothetical protein ABZ714_19760 [Streptomyces sp. NPDC006798]|uniref:hypothetical protein n=1 Tax=Streptomyces sp. NPDC006798 TaxID=3155462 RepID=UPI0033D71274